MAVTYDWTQEKLARVCAVDAAAAGLIAALQRRGINASGGKGRMMDGIRKIQDRLKIQGDKRPRLTVDPSCVNTINEFESHVWRPEKDVPVDADNHALGALRYLEDVQAASVAFLSAEGWGAADVASTGPRTEQLIGRL